MFSICDHILGPLSIFCECRPGSIIIAGRGPGCITEDLLDHTVIALVVDSRGAQIRVAKYPLCKKLPMLRDHPGTKRPATIMRPHQERKTGEA